MTRTFQIIDTTATDDQECSAVSSAADTVQARQLSEASFGTDQAGAHNGSGQTIRMFYFLTGAIGETTWPSGTATLNFTVAIGNSNVTADSVYFCRLDSGASSAATWNDLGGSNPGTGLSEALTAGDHAFSVDVVEDTGAATDDLLCVILNVTINTHGSQAVTYDASQATIVTPFPTPATNRAPKLYRARVQALYPKIRM